MSFWLKFNRLSCFLSTGVFIVSLGVFTAGCKGRSGNEETPSAKVSSQTIAPVENQVEKPNVIFIVVDTLRADRVGTYGYPVNTTPSLDAFAKEAIVFENAFSTAPWTLPSIASMLTGQYPYVLGIRRDDTKIDDRFVFLPELFKKAGYSTGAVISYVYLTTQFGMAQGIDHMDDTEQKGRRYASSPGVTKKGLSFVKDAADKPFFLLLHYFDPHYDYVMHEQLNTFPEYEGPLKVGLTIYEMREMAKDMNPDDLRYLSALYDSEVRFTDHHLGVLFDNLKKLGRYDNSIIVVVADHGEELADRPSRWVGHTLSVTNETIHVPLMIKLLGGRNAGRILQNVSLVDLMPTVAKLAEIDDPNYRHMHGRPLDLENPQNNRKSVFSETGKMNRFQAVVWGDWKLVHRMVEKTSGLFNLAKDPREATNVLKLNKSTASKIEKMRGTWNKEMDEMRSVVKPTNDLPDLSDEQKEQLRAMGYVE